MRADATAPGKVLIVGGYLVLQEGIRGYVVSTSSRFHARVEWVPYAASAAPAPIAGRVRVSVRSPQFGEVWEYDLPSAGACALEPVLRDSEGKARRNPYVEYAIEVATAAVAGGMGVEALHAVLADAAVGGRALCVSVEADNDFYSQRAALLARGLPVCRASLQALPPRTPCPVHPTTGKAIVAKTGLGSSAALVTSVSAATLALLAGVLPSSSLVHAVAQVAHGLAQGKVGSGFDVASASFGSIAYDRVPPIVLGALMSAADACIRGPDAGAESVQSLGQQVQGAGEGEEGGSGGWKFRATPFQLPPGLALALADVAGGSETPGMVRDVLAWKAAQATAEGCDQDGGPALWRELAGCNVAVAHSLSVLDAMAARMTASGPGGVAAYFAALGRAAGGSSPANAPPSSDAESIPAALVAISSSFAAARTALRRLGEEAGVPIEPREQGELADATLALPGVLAAGVPGAGGYDALFAIIVDVEGVRVREGVEALWTAWPSGALTPLLLVDGPGRGQEGAGVVVTLA